MGAVPNVNGKICRCFLLSQLAPKPEPSVEKSFLTKAIEGFYDNCAAYNMRHVPYRTVTEQTVSLKTIAKDFAVLFGFVAASFVVFLTILSRIAMHLGRLCLNTEQWVNKKIRRYLANRQRNPPQERQAPNNVETIEMEDKLQNSYKDVNNCVFSPVPKRRGIKET